MRRARLVVLLIATISLQACGTTSTYSTTWTDPYGAPAEWARTGRVEWVRETIERRDGNPAGGAAAGAIIGGLLGGRGPGALFGAVGGAAIGAAASEGSSERRTYDVMVRFDDGGSQAFVFAAPPPFRTGQPVVLTSRGLSAG
jgi:outer membrane lipoprotein SlyB